MYQSNFKRLHGIKKQIVTEHNPPIIYKIPVTSGYVSDNVETSIINVKFRTRFLYQIVKEISITV
jgi:hypothetical protein